MKVSSERIIDWRARRSVPSKRLVLKRRYIAVRNTFKILWEGT